MIETLPLDIYYVSILAAHYFIFLSRVFSALVFAFYSFANFYNVKYVTVYTESQRRNRIVCSVHFLLFSRSNKKKLCFLSFGPFKQ